MPSPDSAIVRALSVRQPYAEQILLGKKTIEYRSRNSNIRERVYLYASKGAVDDPAEWRKAGAKPGTLPTGVIVGTVEIVGSAYDEDEDIYEWTLARPARLATPLEPMNQPQPGVWRPQFKGKPATRSIAVPEMVPTRSPAASPSALKSHQDAGSGITGGLVCYHNPDSMGGAEIWEVGKQAEFQAVSARHYNGAVGKRLWFVTGRGSPRRYYVAGWYTVDEVVEEYGDYLYKGTIGHVASQQSHLVEIGMEPWFKDLRRACANFATTQHVRDVKLLKALERAWEKTRAPTAAR